MNEQRLATDVVIVGGGLAGLTAASLLARAGWRVTLFEKARHVGGRAMTEAKHGFHFNLGPHALYRGAEGIKILRELDVTVSGGVPPTAGAYAIDGGTKHTLPAGPFSLLTTGLLGLPAKLELARLLGNIGKLDAQAVLRLTVNEWLAREIRHEGVRQLLRALIRVTSYGHDPDRQSAGAAIAQLQRGLATGVLYLHGGWQTLIEGLRATAAQAGVRIVTGARVETVARDSNGRVSGVRLADGAFHAASSVVIAASPAEAYALVERGEETVLHSWAQAAIPMKVACLDVALQRLPQPRALFALGIDQPLYFSVHSATAKLAPEQGAMIHAARYLGAHAADDPRAVERELEELFDLMQPGWRNAVVVSRFLPALTVSHGLVTAVQGGTMGRLGPAVPGVAGLYVAGDWVGAAGMLADASLASAQLAAQMICAQRPLAAAA